MFNRQVFNQNVRGYHSTFQEHGYVHLKRVISSAMLDYLSDCYTRAHQGTDGDLAERRLGGWKRQFLFKFPSYADALELREVISRITDLPTENITLSERHLYIYDDNAADFPAPHKDRSASLVAIGIPVFVPDATRVCVLPHLGRDANTAPKAIYQSEYANEAAYAAPETIQMREEVGDMVMFLGSQLYHARIRPAGTATVYFKVNIDGSDPLRENIYAEAQAAQ